MDWSDALSVAAVVVAVLTWLTSHRHVARSERLSRSYSEMMRIEDRSFRRIRHYVLGDWDGAFPTGDSDRDAQVREFSNTMDVLGYLYVHGYLDRRLFVELYGRTIPNGFDRCAAFRQHVKASSRVGRYQEWFAAMSSDIRKRHRRKYPHDEKGARGQAANA